MFRPKVAIIGLDAAVPELIWRQWGKELPNLTACVAAGLHGPLRSTVPPITVPAWTSMLASVNPGRLGFYGFRNRRDYSYDGNFFALSDAVREKRVWDILSAAGKRSVVLGVPQTYPVSPLHGCMVSCFLAPGIEDQYTYPHCLRDDIARWVGEYILDVENFRTDDKDRLLNDIYAMTDRRFEVAKRLLAQEDWDFFIMVEMGVDRIQHGFWQFMDPRHVLHQPGSPYREAIKDYYLQIDRHVGEILDLLDDDTLVMVVSDHGAQRMDGGICFNEWLIREGYLALREIPVGVTPLARLQVDWGRTVAWGEGGYYGRLFLNVKGREPEGVVEPGNYERVRDEIASKLRALTDEHGRNIGTRAFKPEEVYGVTRGIPPDLIVYFGDLYWRSIGSVGHGTVWSRQNDTGPDGANHSEHGVFIMARVGDARPRGTSFNCRHTPAGNGRWVEGLHLLDVAPTVLHYLGLPVPSQMEGRAVEI